jgi:glycosyltransferase involved in cell wall biosynthesis
MAARVFPIVYDNAANRYWIEPGKNGLLLENDSAETVAQAIERTVRDVALRQAAYKINRDIVFERANLERNTHLYFKRFSKLIDEHLLNE